MKTNDDNDNDNDDDDEAEENRTERMKYTDIPYVISLDISVAIIIATFHFRAEVLKIHIALIIAIITYSPY